MKKLLMLLVGMMLLTSCETAYVAVDDDIPTYYWWPSYSQRYYIHRGPVYRHVRPYHPRPSRPPKAHTMRPHNKKVMPPRR